MFFYSEGFRQTIEDHMTMLLKSSYTARAIVKPDAAQRNHGDFFGLLSEMGIEPQYHWTYMRVNGYSSPYEYDKQDPVFFPDQDLLNRIVDTYRSVHKTG